MDTSRPTGSARIGGGGVDIPWASRRLRDETQKPACGVRFKRYLCERPFANCQLRHDIL
jgi:hypothetical protein